MVEQLDPLPFEDVDFNRSGLLLDKDEVDEGGDREELPNDVDLIGEFLTKRLVVVVVLRFNICLFLMFNKHLAAL